MSFWVGLLWCTWCAFAFGRIVANIANKNFFASGVWFICMCVSLYNVFKFVTM